MSEAIIQPIPLPLAVHFAPKTLTQLGINANILEMHASYQPASTPKTGLSALLGKLPLGDSKPVAMDIDIGCGLYDHHGTLIDAIWYGRTRNSADSVRHTGDDFHGLTQTAESLSELLSIRLLQIDNTVARLAMFIHSHHKQPLSMATAGKTVLRDNEDNDIHHIDFKNLDIDCTAMCAWQMIRTTDDWRIEAPMQPLKADNIDQLMMMWQDCL